MDIASAVCGFLTCLCTPNCINTPIVGRCKYVMNPKKYKKKLGNLKACIIAHQKDVIRRLEEAELVPGCRRSNVVTKLLEDVDMFLEATRIEEEAKKTKPNVRMGSNISRLLREATKLELLLREVGLSREALTVTEERRGLEFPVRRIIGETTAHKNMEVIWGCLMNDEIRIVSVYGMGGVGKTTIVTKINNRLLEEKLFDSVIWVTVSKSTSIRQIQVSVTRAFNLSRLDTEDEKEVSASILHALKQRKKVVLILDDMWEAVSLSEIGIPEPTKENGWKVILTSRSLEVCRKMGCQKESTIKVEPLSKKEALELFMDGVGVKLSEEVQTIAENVVEECACLPLAIITVSGAMRGIRGISEWRVALNDLRYFRQHIVDMETTVFKCLKFSYDQLRGEDFKKCFLYCALFPEDWEFVAENLIDYWIMGGLIEGKDSQDEIDQGQSILNKLRNHCLLENVHVRWKDYFGHIESSERVKMHDLIRDMALHVTSLLPYITETGGFLKELPNNEAGWREDLEGASFIENEIEEISISPRCPKLSILLLNSNRLHSIQEHFFVQLQGLKVLDLSRNWSIEFLPDSISDLVNLRGLLLEGCYKLMSLPSLHKLQLLRTLDLRHSNLQSLPDSISELTNLLELRLSNCRELKSVPSVAKLRSLRKLELDNSGIMELPQGMEMLVNLTFLDLEDTNFTSRETTPSGLLSALSSLKNLGLGRLPLETVYVLGSSNRGIWEDLLSLKQLESLYIIFSSLSDCANYVGSPDYKGLEIFSIWIGSIYAEISNIRPLSEDICRSVIVIYPNDVSYHSCFLPQNTQYFYIKRFEDMRSLNDLRCLKDARELRECTVSGCDSLEYIIKHEEEDECTLLQGLEMLRIDGCPKLQCVYKGILSSVYCLTRLEITECDNLKNVFSSPRLLQQLQSLEHICIRSCYKMEEIIKAETAEEEREATNIIMTLPNLKYLYILDLPTLKNIWNGEMVCDSLLRLKIEDCYNLKNVFSSPRSLQQHQSIERITITRCWEIEEIIKVETAVEEGEATNIITLPKLKRLKLLVLPKLKNIWNGEMVCNLLQQFVVINCRRMKRIPTLRGDKQLPPPLLFTIKGNQRWWDSLEWDHPFAKKLFQRYFTRVDSWSGEVDSLGDDLSESDVDLFSRTTNQEVFAGNYWKILPHPLGVEEQVPPSSLVFYT